MPDFDLTGELSLKIELHMLRPITEKVHSGNGPVSLVNGSWVIYQNTPNLFLINNSKTTWILNFDDILSFSDILLHERP